MSLQNNFIDVMAFKYAGKKWSSGETYASLDWTDNDPKPTLQQVETADTEYTAHLAANAYKKQRAAVYPPIEEQLDALWKGGQAEIDMKAQIDAIKIQYPKPGD